MAVPSGSIHLLENVPLNASYEHTIDFKDREEQFSYFANFVERTIEQFTYVRKERESIVVELPIDTLDSINYMLFSPKSGERLYYAFVTNKVYVNPTSTQIFYIIDVMQTYQFDYKWQESYVKQAHVDRWTADHLPIYSKTDEGLDYGTEYSIESAYKLQQSKSLKWLLLTTINFIAPKEDGEASGFDVTGGALEPGALAPVGTPFFSFLVPLPIKLKADNNPYAVIIANEAEQLQLTNSTYEQLLRFMTNTPFGNYIRSISLLPYNPLVASEAIDDGLGAILCYLNSTAGATLSTISYGGDSIALFQLKNVPESLLFGSKVLATTEWNTGLEGSLPTAEEWDAIKSKPYDTKRDKRWESKLLCAPYRYNLLTDWRNSPVIFTSILSFSAISPSSVKPLPGLS